MKKASLDFNDLSIAPRKTDSAAPARSVVNSDPSEADEASGANVLPKPSPDERRELAESRARAQDDVRTSLKNLKRSKQRSVKFFINIALDYELKARLQKAAMENDLKMTQVVKAALEYFLSANDY